MRNTTFGSLVLAGALALSPAIATATTIDFSAVQGDQGSTLILPEATLTNTAGGTVLVGSTSAGEADGFCFLGTIGCDASGTLAFSGPVTNLTFDVDGADPGDSVQISAYDGATLLGDVTVTANGVVDFTGYASITLLVFTDASSAAGVGYSTFQYDAVGVPTPGALSLFGAGLLGLGMVRRRRNAEEPAA